MSAKTVIENLIRIGVIVSDAASNHKDGKAFDAIKFLNSDATDEIKEAVKSILTALKPDDLLLTIKGVEEKQKTLLSGRSIPQLDTDELIQYDTLTNTKLVLNAAYVKRVTGGDFFEWLMEGGLESIVKVAKVAIPLLV